MATATARKHRGLGCRPIDCWDTDFAATLALPPTAPATGCAGTVRLGRDHYVRVDSNDYSVHPSVIGRKVAIRADLDTVRAQWPMHHGAPRSTAVMTHHTNTNCFGGQVIPQSVTDFHRVRFPPAPRRRGSMSPATSPHGTGDRRPQVASDHSKILVISTYDDNRENTLRCGEVLSRVLLECTAAGFATCTLTHMIEVHASRETVRRLTDAAPNRRC